MKTISILPALITCGTSLFLPDTQTPLDIGETFKIPGDNMLQYCQNPENHILQLEYLTFHPNPPVPQVSPPLLSHTSNISPSGQNLTITASGLLTQLIQPGAYAHVVVKWGYFKLIDGIYNICTYAPSIDKKCPLKQGAFTLEREVKVRDEVPRGSYRVMADVYTVGKERITCGEGEVTFE